MFFFYNHSTVKAVGGLVKAEKGFLVLCFHSISYLEALTSLYSETACKSRDLATLIDVNVTAVCQLCGNLNLVTCPRLRWDKLQPSANQSGAEQSAADDWWKMAFPAVKPLRN